MEPEEDPVLLARRVDAKTCHVCSARNARVVMLCCKQPICEVCLVDMCRRCDEHEGACVFCRQDSDGDTDGKTGLLGSFVLRKLQLLGCGCIGVTCLLLLVCVLLLLVSSLTDTQVCEELRESLSQSPSPSRS